MCSHMEFKFGILHKPFIAHVTNKLFDVIVNFSMRFQIRTSRERFLTDVAFETPFARMTDFVPRQVAFRCKIYTTILTFETIITMFDFIMEIEQRPRLINLITIDAIIDLLGDTMKRYHVTLPGFVKQKSFRAMRARERVTGYTAADVSALLVVRREPFEASPAHVGRGRMTTLLVHPKTGVTEKPTATHVTD